MRPFAAFTDSRRSASLPRPGPARPTGKKNGHHKGARTGTTGRTLQGLLTLESESEGPQQPVLLE